MWKYLVAPPVVASRVTAFRSRSRRRTAFHLASIIILILTCAAIAPAPKLPLPTLLGAPAAANEPGSTTELVFQPPVSTLVVRRFFDYPHRYQSGHRGLDLLSHPTDPVHAPAPGKVSFSDWVVNRPVLSIDHGGGWRTTYEPVVSALVVGSSVQTGDIVGQVSATAAHSHCAPEICLHWGVKQHGEYRDPLLFLTGFGPIQLQR